MSLKACSHPVGTPDEWLDKKYESIHALNAIRSQGIRLKISSEELNHEFEFIEKVKSKLAASRINTDLDYFPTDITLNNWGFNMKPTSDHFYIDISHLDKLEENLLEYDFLNKKQWLLVQLGLEVKNDHVVKDEIYDLPDLSPSKEEKAQLDAFERNVVTTLFEARDSLKKVFNQQSTTINLFLVGGKNSFEISQQATDDEAQMIDDDQGAIEALMEQLLK